MSDGMAATCCVHCSSLLVQKKKWPVSTKIGSKATVVELLRERVPESKFSASEQSFICDRCYTILKKITQKQEEAALMLSEVMKGELELKLLMPEVSVDSAANEEVISAFLENKNASEDDMDTPRVEWLTMMTINKSRPLVTCGSVKGTDFLEQNRDVLNKFPSFCFPHDEEVKQSDHNYSTRGSSVGDEEEKSNNKDFESSLPMTSLASQWEDEAHVSANVTGRSPRKRGRPAGRHSRKKGRSKATDVDSSSETEWTTSNIDTKSKLSVTLRTRKGIGSAKDKSYSSYAGFTSSKKTTKNQTNLKSSSKKTTKRQTNLNPEATKQFVLSHIEVFSLDHSENKEAACKLLKTFQKIDPENSPSLGDINKPWACMRCSHTTTCRKRALLHFRKEHDARNLWARFHICQTGPEKSKDSEELQDHYRLHKPYLCVLCGRDYLKKTAEQHITKDHPGVAVEQIPLVIVKKDAGPKLIILYLFGRQPLYYFLDLKGRLCEVLQEDISQLKQKITFTFHEVKPPVPMSSDEKDTEEDTEEKEEEGTNQNYRVEITFSGCSPPGDKVDASSSDLSTLRTRLLGMDRADRCMIPSKKKKICSSDEIDHPKYACRVCHAATNSKKIQEMHDTIHPKQIGKWECTLCGDRFKKANLIMTHIGIFHDLLAQDALSHMKAIGIEASAGLLDHTEGIDVKDDCDSSPQVKSELTEISSELSPYETHNGNMKESQESRSEPGENLGDPSTEEVNVWKKQLATIDYCDVCCKSMKTKVVLMKHMRTIHKIRNYRCPICSESFISYSLLLLHLEESHTNVSTLKRNFLCISCHRVFTCRQDFVTHCVNHIKDNFSCNICNETLNSSDKLSLHMKNHDPVKAILDTPYICPICNKVIKERKKVEMHLMTHCTTMIESYRCTQCPKTCVTEQGLRNHIELHKVNRGMVCHICGKVFKRLHRMRDHLRMHDNPEPFKCQLCKKMVSSDEAMKRHMELVHSATRKKEVVCHLCGKELASNYSLTMHMKLVHNPFKIRRPLKNRECKFCGKVYSKPYQLARHIEVHHSVHNCYVCKYCGKQFGSRALYRHHVDVHPEFKPWRCSICKEKFVFQKSLLDHMIEHHPDENNTLVEKRFVCKICGNSYGKLWSLRNHLDVEHNDERQLENFEKIRFKCRFCDRGFLYKTGMDIHITKEHKDQMDAEPSVGATVQLQALVPVGVSAGDTIIVVHEETVAASQADAEGISIAMMPETITLEEEVAVQLLHHLQYQVEQNYAVN